MANRVQKVPARRVSVRIDVEEADNLYRRPLGGAENSLTLNIPTSELRGELRRIVGQALDDVLAQMREIEEREESEKIEAEKAEGKAI